MTQTMLNNLSPVRISLRRLGLLSIFFIGSALLIGTTGCDRTYIAENTPASSPADAVDAAVEPAVTGTTSVAADKLTNMTSPAETADDVVADATPKEVCRSFMNLLQSGNRISAENLLTRTALTVTTRAGLQLEPMGGPNSVFKFNDVMYATTKKKLAQVECSIVDKVDGEDYEMDIVWLVRKHSTGWRISGVMLELEPGKSKDLLSFENVQDVTKIKALAGEDVIDEKTRQAKEKEPSIR